MRHWIGLLASLAVVALAGTASPAPTIGVYFDQQGTNCVMECVPGQAVTAYILATHAEQTVGGAAFQLQVDSRIALINATYPPGIQVGTLVDGIQIGFTNCYYGYYDQPVLLASLTLMPIVSSRYDATLRILPYPPAGVVQLADCYAEITSAVPFTPCYLRVSPPRSVGVYWDQAGTQTSHTANGGGDETHTAYIVALNTECWVGGAAFKLDMDPRITLTGATFAPGTQGGTLAQGIDVGFDPPLSGIGQPVLIATLSLWTGNQIIPDGWLQIAASSYGPYAGVLVWEPRCDFAGCYYYCDGGRATLTIPVRAEDKSWGEVKSLYAR